MLSPSYSSITWASRLVPSVGEARAWVSPRVKTAVPWVRGGTPRSVVVGRVWARRRVARRARTGAGPRRPLAVPVAEPLGLRPDDPLAPLVAPPAALEEQLHGALVGAALHPHHRLLGADHPKIQVRHVAQAVGRVHHHLAV